MVEPYELELRDIRLAVEQHTELLRSCRRWLVWIALLIALPVLAGFMVLVLAPEGVYLPGLSLEWPIFSGAF